MSGEHEPTTDDDGTSSTVSTDATDQSGTTAQPQDPSGPEEPRDAAAGTDPSVLPAGASSETVEAPAEVAEPSAEVVEPSPEAAEPAAEVAPGPVGPPGEVSDAPVVGSTGEAVPADAVPAAAAPTDAAPAEPVSRTEPATAPSPEEPSPDAPTPAPRPTPRPGGRATPAVLARPRAPRPGAPRPQASVPGAGTAGAQAPAGPTVPVRPASDPTAWGRVDQAGTVFVRTADGEREVGSEPAPVAPAATAAVETDGTGTGERPVDADQPTDTDRPVDAERSAAVLAPYGIRFDELVAQVDLVEQRLAAGEGAPADAVGTLRALRSSLATVAAVGDLDALSARTREVEAVAAAARAAADAERAAVREAAMSEREEVVAAAEAIAATETSKMQWRPAGERLKELLETWKGLQRSSRLDKRTEDELWKRFSAARTGFDRARRAHFSALEGSNAEAKAAKTALVVEAESMVTSSDWGTTAQGYKRLMDRWRTAGHAGRRDDDALWARFRAAQDSFFAARHAAAQEEDASFAGNLVVKEELLVAAEALLPVRDHRAARRALRDIGERWDEAGKVPRADLARVEGRLRKVETAVADAEKATWTRADPEKSERASGAVAQLERAVAQLTEQLEAAESTGDEKAAQAARAALEARQGWLDAARATAAEFSG